VAQTINVDQIQFATIGDDEELTLKATVTQQPGVSPINITATGRGSDIAANSMGDTDTMTVTAGSSPSSMPNLLLDPAAGQGEEFTNDLVPASGVVGSFAFTPTQAGTYAITVWHDADLDSAIDEGSETYTTLQFTVTQAPGSTNRAVEIVDAEATEDSVDIGDTVVITVDGSATNAGVGIGETVSYTASLTVPEDSDVTLADRDGEVAGATTVFGTGTAASFTAALSQSDSRVTLTRTTSSAAAFADLDLGDWTIIPDVEGTYTLRLNSTNELGVATGEFVSVTIEVAPDLTLDEELEANIAELDKFKFTLDANEEDALEVGRHGVNAFTQEENEDGEETFTFAEVTYIPSNTDKFSLSLHADYDYYVSPTKNVRFTISGPAIWSEDHPADDTDYAQASLSSDRKVLTWSMDEEKYEDNEDGYSYDVDSDFDFDITGTGTITISVHVVTAATGAATRVGLYTLEVVSASAVGAYSAADSFAQLQITPTTLAAVPTPKIDVVGASTRPNTDTAYLALYLRDIYDGPVSGAGKALVATATGGAIVRWGAIPIAGTSSVETSNLSTPILWIRQGTATTTTVEVKLNDVVVATKTVTWTGAASGIAISSKKVSVPVSASTAAFKYAISDAAGARVASSATVSAVDGIYVTAATAAAGSATAASDVTVTCSALRGKGSVTLTYATTKTETVEVICAGGIASFEVTTSKTAFERSEIGVLTITAKDAAGNPVPDSTVLASAAARIQFTGAGAVLAKSPAATDTFTDGKIDYAFTTSATAGSYSFALWHADLSPAVTKIAQFTVTAPAVAPTYTTPTLTASLEGNRVLLFGACSADEGDMIVYVKSPGGAWKERAKTLECVVGEFEGSINAPKTTKYFRVKQEGTGLWSPSVLVRR
jgi:hypothetical protein